MLASVKENDKIFYMSRSLRGKLSVAEQRELLGELCLAIIKIGTLDNAIRFIIDLFSKQEITMIAKRLKIAQYLLEGEKYEVIQRRLKVGANTIARIQTWLDEGGNGFRFVYRKTRDSRNPLARIFHDDLDKYNRPSPGTLYHWPGLLLEEIIATANKRQRTRLFSILNDIPRKQKIHRELMTLFRNHK